MKFWMIANVNHESDMLPVEQSPRYMHWDKDEAEKELLRLGEKIPRGHFVMLESVAFAQKNGAGLLCVETVVE